MGTMTKVSAAVLVTAILLYLATRAPVYDGVPPVAEVGSPAGEANPEEAEPGEVAQLPGVEAPSPAAVGRTQAGERPPVVAPTAAESHVLRVLIEGITADDAQDTTVILRGVYRGGMWPAELQKSWPGRGLSNEFDMAPFFTGLAEAGWTSRLNELEVHVLHPRHLVQRARLPLSAGVQRADGRTVYEVRASLNPPVYWPEFTLSVRDAQTRAHLDDVELRCVPAAFMASQLPEDGEPMTRLGQELSSPIGLYGGREAEGPDNVVAGMALRPDAGESRRPESFFQSETTDRGVIVFARAPGYAWGQIVVDVSTGAERELLLKSGAALTVQMSNVQRERYAELEFSPTVRVLRSDPRGGEDRVWAQDLDAKVEAEGLSLDGLEPGEYIVYVDLSEDSWRRKKRVLAREEITLAAGERRTLSLAVADAPPPPVLASLGGVISFPHFGGEKTVSLQLYEAAYFEYGGADVDLSLTDLERVGGALPTWSFRVEDLPVGLYQIQLWPFLKNWMVEVPAGGIEDLELVIPELAEVTVEAVDAQTGDLVPLEEIRYGSVMTLPGQVHRQWNKLEFDDEPGRFRFWSAPGDGYIATLGIPPELHYGGLQKQDTRLAAGPQSIRFELSPGCTIRFEFRVGGVPLPRDDDVWVGLSQTISAIQHEGHVAYNELPSKRRVGVSAPGLYEISFEGIGEGRFLPIPPQRVDVRPGEAAEVVVELRRP